MEEVGGVRIHYLSQIGRSLNIRAQQTGLSVPRQAASYSRRNTRGRIDSRASVFNIMGGGNDGVQHCWKLSGCKQCERSHWKRHIFSTS